MMEEDKSYQPQEKDKKESVVDEKLLMDPVDIPEDVRLLSQKFDLSPFNSIGTEPIDGEDPLVYSTKTLVGPYSFMDPEKMKPNPKMPPPTYLKEEEVPYNMKFSFEDLMKGLEIAKDGGLVCTDKEILNKQKGILGIFLGQVIKFVIKGGSFVGISLPVKIFEGRSTIDKIIDTWRLAPIYLSRAAVQTDPILRMKDIIILRKNYLLFVRFFLIEGFNYITPTCGIVLE